MAFLLLMSSVSLAAANFELKDAAYFCNAEVSAGLKLNERTNKWESSHFEPDTKFVLRLKFINVRNSSKENYKVTDYSASITQIGSSYASPCTYYDDSSASAITVNEFGLFSCKANLMEYFFSGRNLRFLRTYMGSYVSGFGTDTPVVTGGICTKIE